MRYSMRPDILTFSGKYFNFVKPDPDSFSIMDIAHALANLCRFNGHCRQFYSVAQHSTIMSYIVPIEFAMQALMHDSPEFAVGDMTRPLKALFPDYREIEKRVQDCIFTKFGLPLILDCCIKEADMVMLCTEQRDLMPAHDDVWAGMSHVEPLKTTIWPQSPAYAKMQFLARFEELGKL